MLVAIVIDKVWINPQVTVGIPSVLTCIALFAGVQLMMLGMLGEYVGRIFLQQNGTPQYVVRYVQRGKAAAQELQDTCRANGQTCQATVH